MIHFPPSGEASTEFSCEPRRLNLLSLTAQIVIIDDEGAVVRLLSGLLRRAGFTAITGLTDPRQLPAVIASCRPDLVITDLHMPGYDEYGVLCVLSSLINTERLPVLVITGDASQDTRQQALLRGAADFITKPFDQVEVLLRVRNLLETRVLYQDLVKRKRALPEIAHGRGRDVEGVRVELAERLALSAEYRDDHTNRHSERVGLLAQRIAIAMGASPERAALVCRAAALHDIGKIGIPDALLFKPTALSATETVVMRTHTTIGARILGGSRVPMLRLAESIALTHHERWDGSGYPQGLIGDAIPLEGRIVAVADAFDAMTSGRVYRAALSAHGAVAILTEQADRQFDATAVHALKEALVKDASTAEGLGLADLHATVSGVGAIWVESTATIQ